LKEGKSSKDESLSHKERVPKRGGGKPFGDSVKKGSPYPRSRGREVKTEEAKGEREDSYKGTHEKGEIRENPEETKRQWKRELGGGEVGKGRGRMVLRFQRKKKQNPK